MALSKMLTERGNKSTVLGRAEGEVIQEQSLVLNAANKLSFTGVLLFTAFRLFHGSKLSCIHSMYLVILTNTPGRPLPQMPAEP